MLARALADDLRRIQLFFKNSIHVLEEADSGFRPRDEMYTVAQHIAHATHAVRWFAEGAFSSTGPVWDEDVMAEHESLLREAKSLREEKIRFDQAIEEAVALFAGKSDEELMAPLPADSLMGPSPRLSTVSGIRDHTAHHRGALTVYARLLNKTPSMPFMPPAEESA